MGQIWKSLHYSHLLDQSWAKGDTRVIASVARFNSDVKFDHIRANVQIASTARWGIKFYRHLVMEISRLAWADLRPMHHQQQVLRGQV